MDDTWGLCVTGYYEGFCGRKAGGHMGEPLATWSALVLFGVAQLELLTWHHRSLLLRALTATFVVHGIGSSLNHATGFTAFSFLDGQSQVLIAWLAAGYCLTTAARHRALKSSRNQRAAARGDPVVAEPSTCFARFMAGVHTWVVDLLLLPHRGHSHGACSVLQCGSCAVTAKPTTRSA